MTSTERGPDPQNANRVLGALPTDVYEALAPRMKRPELTRGQVLHRPGDEIHELYFPVDCVISITVEMRDNKVAEAGLVGSREMVGINAFMGGRETTQTEYIVQLPGSAIRIDADLLRDAFDNDKRVRDVFLKSTQAMIAQVTQTAACNSLHSMEQRYARWLLEVHERLRSDKVNLTHEFLAEMLGVRRAGITTLAGRFEKTGIIEAGRGWVRIVDVERLEKAACECFSVLLEEFDRLLGTGLASGARA